MKKVSPFLWFDGTAQAAAEFYTSIFYDSAILQSNPMIVTFKLCGQPFTALNGGPKFKLNPSISLFVICDSVSETEAIWNKLSEGATVMMPLNTYDWSERYGFLQDKFGLSWQIMLGKFEDVGQKITPSMLFVGSQYGHAEEAVRFYTSVFKPSTVTGILLYLEGESQPSGKVKHAQFTLDGTVMMAMDGFGEHEFAFNESFSLFITCDDQAEVDYYWHVLIDGGGAESQCGWLRDRFGVSWQVIPRQLMELMNDKDPAKSGRVMQAILGMKKIIVKELEIAHAG